MSGGFFINAVQDFFLGTCLSQNVVGVSENVGGLFDSASISYFNGN